MSFLSGLIGPAINVATKAAGAYEGAEANTATADQAAMLQRAQLQRERQNDLLKQAIAKRQAESASLEDHLKQLQANKIQQEMTRPVAPVLGSPEWEHAEIRKAQIGKEYGYHPPVQPPNQQILQTDQGTFQIDPKTGVSRPVMGPNGQQFQKSLGASTQKAIATNVTTVGTIDKALKSIKSHPDATGFLRGRSDTIDQYVDQAGVDTRALVANVGSQIIHDRSGAAVTVSEYPRLAPFVPSAHDRPETVRKKLKQLRAAIAMETEALGGSVAPDVEDDDPVLAKYLPTRAK